MGVAFYAPLKSPDHPIPSGDRAMGRALLRALDMAGAEPSLTCRLRTYDRGAAERQRRLEQVADGLAPRLVRRLRLARPSCWFTYHCHHKAPDLLGWRVAGALGLPYVIAEASDAPKRATGAWAVGHRQARQAIEAADVVLAMSRVDVECLRPLVQPPARLLRFPPFVEVGDIHSAEPAPRARRLLVVAMLREGAKARSFAVLFEALRGLLDRTWTLEIVGDGPARPAIESSARAALGDRVTFLGRIDDRRRLEGLIAAADAMPWPAVDEAYGMALLEAQALGLPVVAGDGHGVPDVVADGVSGLLVPVGDVTAFRAALARLMDEPGLARRLGAAAAAHVRGSHDLVGAARRIGEALALANAVHAEKTA
ncbi:MAG: glycosyltransferase family 4 protein [Pseudomonadota bacterium]